MRHFTRFAYAIGLLMMVPLPGGSTLQSQVETQDMISTASRNFSDVDYLCRAHPQVCTFAAELAYSVESKARSGFGFFYSLTVDAAAPAKPGTVIAVAAIRPSLVD